MSEDDGKKGAAREEGAKQRRFPQQSESSGLIHKSSRCRVLQNSEVEIGIPAYASIGAATGAVEHMGEKVEKLTRSQESPIRRKTVRNWRAVKICAIQGAVMLALLLTLFFNGARGAAPPAGDSYSVAQVSGGGTISGKILYSGKPIQPKEFLVAQPDASICGKNKEVYPVKIAQGGVAEAVVWLDDITSGKAYSLPEPTLDQKNCEFVPHVLLMQPGTVRVANTDLCMHNIHVFSSANREVNRAMPPQMSPIEVTLAHPDQVKLMCEVHKWMVANVFVVKNAYSVMSGAGGIYTLSDVPAGKYHLKVWQESLGTQTQEVVVEAGKTATVDFTVGLK